MKSACVGVLSISDMYSCIVTWYCII